MPFAGHPTLGSAKAWLDARGAVPAKGLVVQECAAGLVRVRVAEGRMAFEAPPSIRYEAVTEELLDRVAKDLEIPRADILDFSWLVNGPRWLGVRLGPAEAVLALRPDPEKLDDLEIGLIGPHAAGSESQFEVRAFFGGEAAWEDPATGRLNAGFAQWLPIQALLPRTMWPPRGRCSAAEA
ncbi:PhzF family phenazine biosynthesis protein [Paeniglutamicibacter psychrophenolicus]|nr:PhzF family phenazine biosynthesis protein [Paeniglutamicibacter psychrophenolicus]